jgi:copper transport protein
VSARLLLAALALCAGEAAAHAELVASTPADGASLRAAPTRIELVFNEPVRPLGLKLLDGAGTALPLQAPQSQGERIEIALPSPLSEGRYTLTYRVVSLDSHPIGGSIAFAVGVAAAPAAASTEGDALRPWRVALRALRDLALLIAVGGALFLLGVGRFPRERAVLGTFAVSASVAAVLAIGFQGAALLGPDASPLSGESWRTGLHSSFGRSSIVAAAGGLILALTSFVPPGRARMAGYAAGALVAVASLPLTGHAALRGGVAPALLGVHGLAAAFWAGSLVALLLVLRSASRGQAAAALQRFSRLGVPAVLLLFLAGSAFAWLQLPALSDLAGSPYGRLIVGKLALFGALIALASLNRFRYLPRLAAGEAGAAPKLERSIAGEIALMAGVVALTALLVQTPPPRAAGFSATASIATATGASSAELSLAPARAGRNVITVRLRDAQGRALDAAEVEISAANAAAGVEPAARPMQRVSAGEYSRDAGELAFPGLWTLEVRARVGDFDRLEFRFEAPVR